MQKNYQQQDNFYISKTDDFWEIASFDPKQTSAFLLYNRLLSIILIASFMLAPTVILILNKETNQDIVLGIVAVACLLGGFALIKNKIQDEILPLFRTYLIKSYSDKIICHNYFLPFIKQVIPLSASTVITVKKISDYSFSVIVQEKDDSFTPLKEAFLYEKEALQLVNILNGTTTTHLELQATKNIQLETASDSVLIHYSKPVNSGYNPVDLARSIIESTLVGCLALYYPVQGVIESILSKNSSAVLVFGVFSFLALALFFWLLKDLVKNYLISTYKFSPKGIQKYIRLFPFIKLQQIPKNQIVLLSTAKKEGFHTLNIALENGQQKQLHIRFETEEQALKYKQQIEQVLQNN